MQKKIFTNLSNEQWLDLRRHDLTSTEISMLFDSNPYMSIYELYNTKKLATRTELADNERMYCGRKLEPLIGEMVQEKKGWSIAPFKDYIRIYERRLGSSFDFKISDAQRGDGILEIKNVDKNVFARAWRVSSNSEVAAPPHIELQLQYQLLVSGLSWGAIGAFVGGNTLYVTEREADVFVQQQMLKLASEFWRSVEEGNAPAPTYPLDTKTVIGMHKHATEEVATADKATEQLLETYLGLKKQADALASQIQEHKARILERIGTAGRVITGAGHLSCGMTKGSEGKLVTPDMVGTYVGARAGYRVFRYVPAKSTNKERK